jgi:hypothetical protein
MRNKKYLVFALLPFLLYMIYIGYTGLSKGIAEHNNLRIAAAIIGMLLIIGMYALFVYRIMTNPSD